MSFDDIPEDREQSFCCRKRHQGSVTQNIVSGQWECDRCDWKSEPENDDEQPSRESATNTNQEDL